MKIVERKDELENAETLRAICDATVEGIILHHRGIILSINAAGAAMFGYAPQEVIGHSVVHFAAPCSIEEVRRIAESEQGGTYSATGIRKDGSTFRVEARARLVTIGAHRARAVVMRDLTEREAAERQRVESISLLRATVDSTADAILVIDRHGRIVLYNERFRLLWGLSNELLLEGNASALAAVEDLLVDPAGFRARIQTLEASPEVESMDTVEFKDGRTIERHSRPQRIGEEVVGRVCSFRDVTSQRDAERTLELAVQMRDEFLGVASHELFTPITSLGVAIRGLRGVDRQGGAPAVSEQRRERLFRNAERQVERLTRLVQELLDVTRIDGGRLELSLESFDLREVARDALERFALELERDQIVATLVAPVPVTGRWDRIRLEQVVTNLLSNAIKFGRGRPVQVAVHGNGVRAELSVRDQGFGVPPDQQARIFERFQRAASSRHFSGLGLGLYITRQIVEAHEGVMRLDSVPGKGSTFTVELPLNPRGGV